MAPIASVLALFFAVFFYKKMMGANEGTPVMREIAQHVAALTQSWPDGHVVLVAEPRMLGLLREPLHKALRRGIELKELAKDYTLHSASALRDQLALNRLLI